MRMTVADIIEELDWGRIMNICPRLPDGTVDPRVYKILNRSESRALVRGDWIGSVQPVKFCITDGCITLPRQVERVDAAKLDGMILDVRNQWFSYLPRVTDSCGGGYWYGYGPFNYAGANLIDQGCYATFRDVIPGSKKLRIYADSPNDVGKEVLIQAVDGNNQVIIESDAYNGFKMTIALPYVESTYFVTNIMGVIKPKTERNLNLYEVATANNNSLRQLAIYEPGETTVELRRYKIPGMQCTSECPHSFMAIVKLRHVTLERETDYLVIENVGAFEEFIRMLEKKDSGNIEAAITAESDGVRELNLEKRNRSPGDQISIAVRSQGRAQPWRHGVGRMS